MGDYTALLFTLSAFNDLVILDNNLWIMTISLVIRECT